MHKKSMDTPTHTSPVKPNGIHEPPAAGENTFERETEQEEERERQRTDATRSPFSKEELRENSIAALRAKAQEHSAKMLHHGTVSGEIMENGRAKDKEEITEEITRTEHKTGEMEKSH